MSRRTATRYALAALLAATIAAPAAASDLPTAPMPRPASTIEFTITLGSPSLLDVEVRGFDFPRSVPPPCCAFDCLPTQLVMAPMPREVQTFRFTVPTLGPIGTALDLNCPLNTNTADHKKLMQFSVGLFGSDSPKPQSVPACDVPKKFGTVCGLVGVDVQPVPVACEKAGKLAGTWVRDLDGIVIVATFSGDEMKLCFTQTDGSTTVCLTVTADYALTKEGLVHGVFSGVDVDVKRDPKAPKAGPIANEFADVELRSFRNELIDCPFSFRVKSTSAGMMVSNLRMGGLRETSDKELSPSLCGMYKHSKDGTVPAPKAKKVHADAVESTTLPSGRYLERHYPQYFSPDPDFPLPRELASQEDPEGAARRAVAGPAPAPPAPPVPAISRAMMPLPTPPGEVVAVSGSDPQAWQPPASVPVTRLTPTQPTNVPGAAFDVMSDVFGQMLNSKPTCQPPMALPQSVPCPAVRPVTHAVPSNMPQLISPACPNASPCPLPTIARPLTNNEGTWIREVGPLLYVVKFAPDHLTITATTAVELPDGKTYTEGIVLTADFHLTRNGTTLVGLITSVDAIIDGTLPPEAADMLANTGEELGRVQKALTDKPFAMNFRALGDTIAIGNVRFPEGAEAMRGPCYPLTVLGGRYTQLGDKPMPKPKAGKMPMPRDLVPTGGYQLPPPPPGTYIAPPTTGYIPPPPNPYITPAGGFGPGFGSSGPPLMLPPLPVNVPNTLPSNATSVPMLVPPPGTVPVELNKVTLPIDDEMPMPRVVEPPATKGGKKGKKKVSAAPPEDLRQIKNEWRRFWFND